MSDLNSWWEILTSCKGSIQSDCHNKICTFSYLYDNNILGCYLNCIYLAFDVFDTSFTESLKGWLPQCGKQSLFEIGRFPGLSKNGAVIYQRDKILLTFYFSFCLWIISQMIYNNSLLIPRNRILIGDDHGFLGSPLKKLCFVFSS